MKTKKEYIAPELTAVEFKAERGYAASGDLLHIFFPMNDTSSGYNSQGQQTWDNSQSNSFGDRW